MQEHQQDGPMGDVSWGRFWGCDTDGKGCEAGGGSAAVDQWWPCLARLAELTAALERRRSEDEEKEQAVEALTLQLRELVGARCGGFGRGTSIIPGLIVFRGLQEAARTHEPTLEQVQALRSELQLLRRTLHEVTQVLGHPGATHGQEGPLLASVSPPCLSVPSLPVSLPASVSLFLNSVSPLFDLISCFPLHFPFLTLVPPSLTLFPSLPDIALGFPGNRRCWRMTLSPRCPPCPPRVPPCPPRVLPCPLSAASLPALPLPLCMRP